MLFFAPSSEKNAGGEKKGGGTFSASPAREGAVTTSRSVRPPSKRLFTLPFPPSESNAHFRVIDPILRDYRVPSGQTDRPIDKKRMEEGRLRGSFGTGGGLKGAAVCARISLP